MDIMRYRNKKDQKEPMQLFLSNSITSNVDLFRIKWDNVHTLVRMYISFSIFVDILKSGFPLKPPVS